MLLSMGEQLVIINGHPHLARGTKFRVHFFPIVLEIWRHERNTGGGRIKTYELEKGKVHTAPLGEKVVY